MFLIFWIIWVIFNGRLTLEIALFGIVIAGGMYAFICKFMNYKPRTDLLILKKSLYTIRYVGVLLIEIVKANFCVMKLVFSSKYEIEPVLTHFKTDLKTKAARVLLANSITLTPGTITVSLEGDEYIVHCLDKSLAEGIDSSVFVTLLHGLERIR